MKISIIMPVCAWPDPKDPDGMPHHHLRASLESIANGGHDAVEILIGSDGVLPNVRDWIAHWSQERGGAHPPIRYIELPFSGKWGNPQRNALLQAASGEMICFQDQDDEFFPNALAEVHRVASGNPGRPLIFRTAFHARPGRPPGPDPWMLWMKPGAVAVGEIGGHMFVVPNRGELLGVWKEDAYEADWHFITQTLENFRAAGIAPCWRGEFISITRPWARVR